MQEQHPYKITPEQGWAAMLPTLETAMPVERHSRRFAMFWWTAAAVSVAAVIMLLVWVNVEPSRSDNSFSSINSPSTTTINPSPADSEITDEGLASGQQSPASTSASESPGNEKQTLVVPQTSKTKSNTHSEQKLIPSSIVSGSGNDNKTQTGNSSADEIVTGTTIAEAAKSDAPFINNATEAQNTIDVLASIPDLDIKSFDTDAVNGLELTNFQFTKVAPPKRDLIVPTLSAGTLAGFENGAGINAMAGVDIKILPKLSLTAGAGYSSYRPDASLFKGRADQEDGSALIRNDLAYQGIGDYLPAEAVFNAAGSDLNSFIETIRQWNLQAGLAYDISRRVQLEGGLTLGFGTSTRSSYPIISFDNSSPVSGDPLVVSYDLDDYNIIRSSSAGFYAGISYALSKRFDLYLRVMHSFDHYLATNQYSLSGATGRSDYIRGINVGMRYNLQGP